VTDAHVARVITSGTFNLDGGSWQVENNIWVIGDDNECVVIDAAHDAAPILEAIGDRRLLAVLLTHAHDDHIGAVRELCDATGAQSWLHPDDRVLWDRVYDFPPDRSLANGQVFEVGGVRLKTLHTPGHAPGACCFYTADLDAVFTGDTLFQGGPGATGRSYSDYPTIIESISTRLWALPGETVVYTGHGNSTTIADERTRLAAV
jgi:glyoxylase-like metal-dependent hydrolase (beta-lactamase superfamily II)